MNPKILLCLLLLAGMTIVFGSAVTAAPPPPLRAVVTPSTNEVRFRETFDVALRVENQSATNQTIRVMNCSWEEHWKSSNTNVSSRGWACTKNFPVNVDIPPGGAYTNKMQMLIYNLIPDKELSFSMGFTAIGSGKTLWSNKVKLRVLPPDTWVRAGKFFRDRNHDGKIDWEISGQTWPGHAVYPYKYITEFRRRRRRHPQKMTGQGVDTYKVDTNFDGFLQY